MYNTGYETQGGSRIARVRIVQDNEGEFIEMDTDEGTERERSAFGRINAGMSVLRLDDIYEAVDPENHAKLWAGVWVPLKARN